MASLKRERLVLEVTHPGENHRNAGFVASLDDFFVLDGTTGLNDRADAGARRELYRVGFREKSVGRQDRSLGSFARFLKSRLARIYPRRLAHPDADRRAVFYDHNGVGFNETADLKSK